MLEDRIRKGITFFRTFKDKADKDLYQKWVLSFCNLVERYVNGEREDIADAADRVFNKESGD